VRTIDLNGPDGNAYVVAGIAHSWCQQLGWKRRGIQINKCKSYNAVLDRFDKLFKGKIDYEFLNDPRDPDGINAEQE